MATKNSLTAGTVVCVNFQLYDDAGNLLEANEVGDPRCFVLGENSFFPIVEDALIGTQVGDTLSLNLAPSDAFGEREEAHIKIMDRQVFGENISVHTGAIIGFETPTGEEIVGEITDFSEAAVEVDFNHPLAGKTIRCDVKVVSVDAT